MACGSCGQRRQTVSTAQAQQIAASEPTYTVIAPDGTKKSFTSYVDAAVHRQRVNGSLTTTG
jgi:hypothetical protein